MWLEIIALAKSAIELARDIAGRRKATPAPSDAPDTSAARAGTVAGASAYAASRGAKPSA